MQTEQMWQDFSDGLYRFIRARVDSDADADDVLQEVFVKVVSHQDRLRDEDRVAGWVFRIASNAVTDHYRSRRPVVELPRVVDVPENAIEELTTCVRPFLHQLREPYREALLLTDLGNLTQAEAAEQVGISVSGMKSRVQRGRAQLRCLFEECCAVSLDARGRIVDYEPRCQSSCD